MLPLPMCPRVGAFASLRRLFGRRDVGCMVPSPLSLDLWEAIIDQLEALPGGRKSLQACSLTCKAWVPRSRYHIFRHLELGPNYKSRFLRVLSMSAMNGAHLHSLRIYASFPRRSHRWMNRLFPAMAASLVNVKELTLECLKWDKLNEASRTSFLYGFQRVEILRIVKTRFVSLTQLVTLAASFPALKVLGCISVRMDQWSPADAIQMPTSFCYLRLLGPFSMAVFLKWFLSLDPVPNISALDLEHHYIDTHDIKRLLFKLGSTLQHLIYSPATCTAALDMNRLGNSIEHNTHLRSIQLLIPFNVFAWTWVHFLLAKITSTKLERVRFDYFIKDFKELHSFCWEKVDCLLAKTLGLPKLASVHMHIVGGNATDPSIVEFVNERLPLLKSRGILSIEWECTP